MKKVLLIITVLLLSGCGWFDRVTTSATGKPTRVCVEGVVYLQFTSGATVAYTTRGEIKTCE